MYSDWLISPEAMVKSRCRTLPNPLTFPAMGTVIWWIGEYEFRLGASQQRLIGMVIPRIAAVQAVRAQYPCIPWLYDRLPRGRFRYRVLGREGWLA